MRVGDRSSVGGVGVVLQSHFAMLSIGRGDAANYAVSPACPCVSTAAAMGPLRMYSPAMTPRSQRLPASLLKRSCQCCFTENDGTGNGHSSTRSGADLASVSAIWRG